MPTDAHSSQFHSGESFLGGGCPSSATDVTAVHCTVNVANDGSSPSTIAGLAADVNSSTFAVALYFNGTDVSDTPIDVLDVQFIAESRSPTSPNGIVLCTAALVNSSVRVARSNATLRVLAALNCSLMNFTNRSSLELTSVTVAALLPPTGTVLAPPSPQGAALVSLSDRTNCGEAGSWVLTLRLEDCAVWNGTAVMWVDGTSLEGGRCRMSTVLRGVTSEGSPPATESLRSAAVVLPAASVRLRTSQWWIEGVRLEGARSVFPQGVSSATLGEGSLVTVSGCNTVHGNVSLSERSLGVSHFVTNIANATCWLPSTATHSSSDSEVSSLSATVSTTATLSFSRIPWTLSHSAPVTVTLSAMIAPPPPPPPPLESTADSILVATIAGPLAGLTLGLSSVSNVQRAMLAMQLVQGCGAAEDDAAVAALSRSHSPTGLSVGACSLGGALHCGAVLGNLSINVGITLLLALYVAVQHRRARRRDDDCNDSRRGSRSTIRPILAASGLPARALPIAVFLLEPTVASSLHLLWYSGGSSAVPYVVAVVGLAAYGASAALLRRAVGREMKTVRAVWQAPCRRRHEHRFLPYAAKALGTLWVRYEPQVSLSSAQRQEAREFLAMFGSVFQKYWGGRWWYYGVGLWSSAATGVLGSVQPTTATGCEAQRAVLLVLCIVAAAAVMVLRPFASTPLQALSALQEVASVATAACAVAGSVRGVEGSARLQVGLSCAGVVLSLYRTLYAARQRQQQQQQLSFSSTTSSSPAPLSDAAREELAHLVFTMSYPSQCARQSEDRLRQLIVFITATTATAATTRTHQDSQKKEAARNARSERSTTLESEGPSQSHLLL